MSCMEHWCGECGKWKFDNNMSATCPNCGKVMVSTCDEQPESDEEETNDE